MHSHYIDSQFSEVKTSHNRTGESGKKNHSAHKIRNNKSSIDVVKYCTDSSSVNSIHEADQATITSQYKNFLK